MNKIKTLHMLVLGASFAGCAAAGVAANPRDGAIVGFHDKALQTCPPAGNACSEPVTLGYRPVAVAQTASGTIVLVTRDDIRLCDDIGKCTNAAPYARLPSGFQAAGVTVGPSNVPIVISRSGGRVSCRTDAAHCDELP